MNNLKILVDTLIQIPDLEMMDELMQQIGKNLKHMEIEGHVSFSTFKKAIIKDCPKLECILLSQLNFEDLHKHGGARIN